MESNFTNLTHDHENITGISQGVRMTVPLTTFTLSSVGNITAIFVIWRNQRRLEKQSVFYTLVMALALLDLMSIILTSPVTFISYTVGHSVIELGGKELCFYSGITMIYFGITSMAIVFTMAVERLIAIKFAFFYHTKVNASKTKMIISALLLGFLAYSVLPLVGFGEIKQQRPGTWCFLHWRATETRHQVFNLSVVAMGIIMMAGTIFCNFYVVLSVILKRRKMKVLNSALQAMSKKRQRKIALDDMQMMVLLAVMTCVFILCYLPLLVRITISQITTIHGVKDSTAKWNLFAVWMASINPVLDPWVYILCRRSTLVAFFKLLKMLVTCKCTKEDFIAVFSSGRAYKRRKSSGYIPATSSRILKQSSISGRSSETKNNELAMKYSRRWKSAAAQSSVRNNNLSERSELHTTGGVV